MLYPAQSPELTPYSFVEIYVMAINITDSGVGPIRAYHLMRNPP